MEAPLPTEFGEVFMNIDPTTLTAITTAAVAVLLALDKAGYYRRRKNGLAAVTKTEIQEALVPLVASVTRLEDKVDRHGERLAVVEAHVKSLGNSRTQF